MKQFILSLSVLFISHLSLANTLTLATKDESLVPADMISWMNVHVSNDRELGVSVVSVFRDIQHKFSVFITITKGPMNNSSVFVLDNTLSMPSELSLSKVAEGVYSLKFKIYQLGLNHEGVHNYLLYFNRTDDGDLELNHFEVK